MSRIRDYRLLVFAICVAILLTLGIRFHMQTHIAAASPAALQKDVRIPHIPVMLKWHFVSKASSPVVRPAIPSNLQLYAPSIPIEAVPAGPYAVEQSADKPAAMEPSAKEIVQEPAASFYEVTAFYLNVRAEPNADSSIVKVVERGSILEVVQATDNGWLEVRGAGFVHGGYAKKVDELAAAATASKPVKQAKVQVASVEAKAASKPVKPNSSVTAASGLTEAHIAQMFEGTALSGNELERAVLDIEESYGINAYFTIAVMKLESGNGKSTLAKTKNNLFGLNATDDNGGKAFSFKSKGDSVREFGQILSEYYVGNGYTTVESVARKYCPANPKWAGLVREIMNGDYSKL